jgi:hypothetical protein
MQDHNKFVTINEAVQAAMTQWAAEGTSGDDMKLLVDEFVLKALTEWEDTPADKLPIKVSAEDAETISGAVLVAMADWHSSGSDFEEMAGLVEEFALSAIEDWEHNRAAHLQANKSA